MKICNNCGKSNVDNAKFCSKCGSNLNAGAPVGTTAANTQTAQPSPSVQSTPIQNSGNNSTYNQSFSSSGNQNKGGMKVIIIVAVIIVAAAVYYMNFKGDKTGSDNMSAEINISENSSSEENYSQPSTEPIVEITTEPTTEKPHTYEVFFGDMTWSEAYDACLSRGGHLVSFDEEGEYEKVINNVVSGYDDKTVFYIGAVRKSYSSLEYNWLDKNGNLSDISVNGVPYWLPGEPTGYDADSGWDEECVILFYYSSAGKWVINDVPNDYLGLASYKSGRMAYICEYE